LYSFFHFFDLLFATVFGFPGFKSTLAGFKTLRGFDVLTLPFHYYAKLVAPFAGFFVVPEVDGFVFPKGRAIGRQSGFVAVMALEHRC